MDVLIALYIWTWMLSRIDCLPVNLTTPPKYKYHPLSPYGIHIRGRDWIRFQVKASNDVHVALQQYYDCTDVMYEVVIGGWSNTRSVIRNAKQGQSRAVFSGIILTQDEFRLLWVSWEGGNITVGRGSEVGSDILMAWADSSPFHVNYAAVSTWSGVTGEWIVESGPCENYLRFTFLQSNSLYHVSDSRRITGTDVALTRSDCARLCFHKIWCRSFSYLTTGDECKMTDGVPSLSDLTETTGWDTCSVEA